LDQDKKQHLQTLKEEYAYDLKSYDRKIEALAELRTRIQSTITKANFLYTINCDHVWQIMRNLKDHYAPSDQARKQEVITDWLKAISRPSQGTDLEKWLQDLETAYDAGVKEQIPDITEFRPHYDFTKAIAAIDPIFTANQEDEFMKLEEQGQVDSLPFKEIIRKFRKTKRIQANREQMEEAQHGAFASLQGMDSDDLPRNIKCICGRKHQYLECYYLIPSIQPKNWIPNPNAITRINEKIAELTPQDQAKIKKAIGSDTLSVDIQPTIESSPNDPLPVVL
jgi:DNA repair exonuclease SbcCD ATPase subunit